MADIIDATASVEQASITADLTSCCYLLVGIVVAAVLLSFIGIIAEEVLKLLTLYRKYKTDKVKNDEEQQDFELKIREIISVHMEKVQERETFKNWLK